MTDLFEGMPASMFERYDPTKFAPKMSFEERCAVLALFRSGMNKRKLAYIFKVNRRTVSHIVNQASPHYKTVREEYRQTGDHDEFFAKYVTPDIKKRVTDAHSAIEAMEAEARSDGEQRAVEAMGNTPMKAANKKAGRHLITNARDRKVAVEIEWRTEDGIDAWYWREDGMTEWLGRCRTSNEAYIEATTT